MLRVAVCCVMTVEGEMGSRFHHAGAAPHAHAVSGYLRKLEHGPNICPLELMSWAVQKRPSSGSAKLGGGCSPHVWPFEISLDHVEIPIGNSCIFGLTICGSIDLWSRAVTNHFQSTMFFAGWHTDATGARGWLGPLPKIQ